jgi:hypothetical protein
LALPVAAVIKVMIMHLHDYYKKSELYTGVELSRGVNSDADADEARTE